MAENPAKSADTKAPEPKPARCRIVEYTAAGFDQPFPAIITRVVSDSAVDAVNLQVFTDGDIGGPAEHPTNVPKGRGPGTWNWPLRS